MDNLFQNKWFVVIISLVFAIALYFFVTMETNKTTESSILPGFSTEVQTLDDVPLEVRMDSEEYVVSGVPEFVKVSLEGKTSALTRFLRQRNYNFFIDLTNLSEGEYLVEVEYENVPEDLTVYIEPKEIEIMIEKRATVTFPVEVDYVNLDKLPIDYELGEPEVNPETVTIISSESVLEKIAMVKVYVDVTDLKEPIRNREVPISVSDIQGNDLNVRIEPETVIISVPVERPSKKVPLQIETTGDLPEGLSLTSISAVEEVDVFGRNSALNELDEIFTEPIDLSEIEESGTIEVNIDVPDQVTMNNETVEITIELEQTRTLTIPITIIGQNNRVIHFANPEQTDVPIHVTGADDIIRSLRENDLEATIDVTDVEEGTKVTVDLAITGPQNIMLEPEFNSVQLEIEVVDDDE